MAEGNPVVKRRRLGSELRRLRTDAGKTLDDAARFLECSPAKISRIETGQVGARVRDIRDLLGLYGSAPNERDRLLDLVRDSQQRDWWQAYRDVVDDEFRRYLGLEDEARWIRIYNPFLVPALLLVEPYTRELLAAHHDFTPDAVERGVRIRMRRAEILERPDPPQVHVVLDESVLRRTVGTPDVDRMQRDRLRELSVRPNVMIQIRPLDARIDPAGFGPFTILEFAESEPPVGYAESLARAALLQTAKDVGRLRSTFDALAASARPL